ncbi:MAG: hypothetical protein J1E97_06465 [Muribaculaceae bacterium]|nr:hypothetical protein [Muribaculaceae bacterium]
MKIYLKMMLGAVSAVALTGCIDDKYDLSDIDTTTQIKINDLVLPLNLEPVLLSDIIKVDPDDKLTEVTIDDKTFYAVQQNGEFYSDGIDVDKFEADIANDLDDKSGQFRPATSPSGMRRVTASDNNRLYFLLSEVEQNLDYSATDIDGNIVSLSKVYYDDVHFKMTITVSSPVSGLTTSIEDLKIKMPAGLDITNVEANGYTFKSSDYNASTGVLSNVRLDLVNNAGSINVISKGLSLESYPDAFTYEGTLGEGSGSFYLDSNFSIEDGTLVFTADPSQLSQLPDANIPFNVKYDISQLMVTAIDGEILYDLTGEHLNIDPIELTDLPDFLDDPETDLKLSNPQIFLRLNNPVGEFGLEYETTLDIQALRNEIVDNSFLSPLIVVPATSGYHNMVLSPNPDNVSLIPDDYKSNIERLTYNNLGNLLSGNGLPNTLDIKLIDPQIQRQEAHQFALGTEIDGIDGYYMFLAPLSLADGSKIVKTIDGWYSDDLKDLNIDLLKIAATASNDLPNGVTLTMYAINNLGEQVSSIGTAKLDPSVQNQPIEIKLEGLEENGVRKPITNLDGISMYVVTTTNGTDDPLAPDQVITLENLKATVTGSYTTKF